MKLFYKLKKILVGKLHNTYAIHFFYVTSPIIMLSLLLFIFALEKSILVEAFYWFVAIMGILALPVSYAMALILYREYKRASFFHSRKYVLLEVKLPKEQKKSPKAMAIVFGGLVAPGRESTFLDTIFRGKTRPRYSFELVSIEGKIHFFVYVEEELRDFVTSQLYSQYPDIVIEEAEDYTKGINYDKDKLVILPIEYKKAKPDPYPIKTYVEFGLDKETSDLQQRTDPLSSVFEFLSSLEAGEQIWIQFVIRKNTDFSWGVWPFKVEYSWHKAAQKQIDAIYDSLVEVQKDGVVKKGKGQLTPSQEEEVQALARTLHADGLDVGIRAIYIARKDAAKPAKRLAPGLVHLFREFSSPNMNNILPAPVGVAKFDYPWQDYKGIREHKEYEEIFYAYKRRSYFHRPYIRPHSIMSPSELATIYHFPSSEVKAPGLTHIETRTSPVPANLPT